MSRRTLEKKLAKKIGKKAARIHFDLLTKEFEQFTRDVENGVPIPSGGWYTSCQRYDCGHHLTNEGDVRIPQPESPPKYYDHHPHAKIKQPDNYPKYYNHYE
jgi:hypothetical protein